MNSVAFAKENEHETARELMKNKGKTETSNHNESLNNVQSETLYRDLSRYLMTAWRK
jgi:hypothetical protein